MRAAVPGTSSNPSEGRMSSRFRRCMSKAPFRRSCCRMEDRSRRWTAWTEEFAGGTLSNNVDVAGSRSKSNPWATAA